MTDPNLIYPGKYDDFTFPEEGSDMQTRSNLKDGPTQEQIEAARTLVKKLREWNDCAFDPDGPGLTIQEVYDMRDQMREAAELLAALTAAAGTGWKCKAQRTADPPQDCDWPVCGCDPYADKVIAALQESSFTAATEPPMELTKEAPDETIRRLAKIIVAAEAGHGGWKVITNDDGSETAYRNLPAAEAAEQIQVLKTVEAATIERCAQYLSRLGYADAAAAIRALKDQAPHSFEDNPLDWRRP